jgi:lycopene beta-cyclase
MILGAGCAGLSLAWNLLELGFTEPILIVDRREHFDNDRTWCFWNVEPTPFSDLATHTWNRWMVHDGHRETVAACPEHPYMRIRSIDFYGRVLDRVAAADHVTLALGRSVLDIREMSRGMRVVTTNGIFTGLRVIDSSGPIPDSPIGRQPSALLQHFFGQTIRVARATFDPSSATLMDFRTSQANGPHFLYLLPLSETEALVENTYLFPISVSRSRHQFEIANYLRMRYDLQSGAYQVLEEESGAIPMTTAPVARTNTRQLTRIGLAGGAARPSSGYAFLRIQRQARYLARRIAVGHEIDPEQMRRVLGPSKYGLFDSIFLQTLVDRPDLAPRIFSRMFSRAKPCSVVRFLGEKSTPIDDLRIVGALPKLPFIAAALRIVSQCLLRSLSMLAQSPWRKSIGSGSRRSLGDLGPRLTAQHEDDNANPAGS